MKIGDPTDPDVGMGPLISRAQRDRVEAHVATAVDDGATLAAGGKRPAGLDTGFYFEPTILTDVTAGFTHRSGGGVRSRADRPSLPR